MTNFTTETQRTQSNREWTRIDANENKLNLPTLSTRLSLILFVLIPGFMPLSVSPVSSADVALLALVCISNKRAKSALW